MLGLLFKMEPIGRERLDAEGFFGVTYFGSAFGVTCSVCTRLPFAPLTSLDLVA